MKKHDQTLARKATAVGVALVCAFGMVPSGAYAGSSSSIEQTGGGSNLGQ
ncbi:hypothetical protein [Gordonibacter sp. An230]|nr:hypothetical protein [Gordonibacter sp. An230]